MAFKVGRPCDNTCYTEIGASINIKSVSPESISSQALVSVVLPCKDAARFIESAINSVLSQTHQQLQLIVVDDGSTDQTVKLIEPFLCDPRVSLVARSNNSGGPAAPRNIGVAQAEGEFIAFIDADDIWVPQKIEIQLAVMCKHELNFSSALHRHFKEDAALSFAAEMTLSDRNLIELPDIKYIEHDMLLRKNCIVTSSVMLRAGLREELHFFEDSHFVAIEDYLAWLHLHQLSYIESAIINAPLIFYRTRKDSISSSKVEMAQKIYKLLSLYEVQGKRLGLIRFYYFATYLIGGVKAVVSGWLNRVLD